MAKKNKIKLLANFVLCIIAIPLNITGIDLLTRKLFETYKSSVELQLIRKCRRPLKIGIYQGSSPYGIVLGNLLLGPSYLDHSTIGIENLELSILVLSSIYKSRPDLKIRFSNVELFLRRSNKGNYLSLPIVKRSSPINISFYMNLDKPASVRVYPVGLIIYLDLKTQVHVMRKLIHIQADIKSSSHRNMQLSSKLALKDCDFSLRLISQNLNISVLKNLVSQKTHGDLNGDIFFTWQLHKINSSGHLSLSNLYIPLFGTSYIAGNQIFNILCSQNIIKISGLKCKYYLWNTVLTSNLKFN